ncbi:uncharacterized protein Dwil_GK13805 [Drosophila willistoni]|uniref:CUB domain-containing protein n=1 Tax=Drosophila willistoni TaxID=7260 RepID=B4NIU3_DROWI|nr:uncharacterized protein LOC6651667 [Drosophila willistoni]EDW83807.2 uncharacterized protein Dwil_GK13805 [Drosophila willistoni]
MLSKRSKALISAFVLTLYYAGVSGHEKDGKDFVTMGLKRSSSSNSRSSINTRRIKSNSQRPGGMSFEGIGLRYTLRYQPGFKQNKLAQQQEASETPAPQPPPPPAVEMTEMPMEMPTPEPAPMEPPTTEPDEPEPEIPTRPTSSSTESPGETPDMSPSPPSATDMMMPMPGSTEEIKPTMKPTQRPPNPMPPRPSSTRIVLVNPLKQLIFGSPVEANLILKQPTAPKSKGKGFLSLFEVIKFPNSKCSVSLGDIRTMEGVCYHEFECKSLGGIPTESCAEGVGVCCIFVNGCGYTTSQQIVYFESPNYPNAVREMMICVLIINVRKGLKQLRLDFQMFELSRPTNGDCLDDQFIVSGHNTNFQIPILCGINTGQHIYIHVGDSTESKVYLSVFVKVSSGARSFNIKVSQLETDDPMAPDNCLQYFTDGEGIVKSFNYDTDGSIVDNREATYFNNLNYAMCWARSKNVCSVSFNTEQLGGDQPDFQIINKDEGENDLVADGQAGAGIFNCPDDFIAINSVRLCGERFNDGLENDDFTMHSQVRDIAAGPIVLPFRTDSEYVGRGFRLLYRQELCV